MSVASHLGLFPFLSVHPEVSGCLSRHRSHIFLLCVSFARSCFHTVSFRWDLLLFGLRSFLPGLAVGRSGFDGFRCLSYLVCLLRGTCMCTRFRIYRVLLNFLSGALSPLFESSCPSSGHPPYQTICITPRV